MQPVLKRIVPAPHEFVLDALAPLKPWTRRMFGCLAIYVEDRIVFTLRERDAEPADNGVWLATTESHHASLQLQFPHMRSIALFGRRVTHWQVLPTDSPDFEAAALRACALVLAGDPRIGKVPKRRTTPRVRSKVPRTGKVLRRGVKRPK